MLNIDLKFLSSPNKTKLKRKTKTFKMTFRSFASSFNKISPNAKKPNKNQKLNKKNTPKKKNNSKVISKWFSFTGRNRVTNKKPEKVPESSGPFTKIRRLFGESPLILQWSVPWNVRHTFSVSNLTQINGWLDKESIAYVVDAWAVEKIKPQLRERNEPVNIDNKQLNKGTIAKNIRQNSREKLSPSWRLTQQRRLLEQEPQSGQNIHGYRQFILSRKREHTPAQIRIWLEGDRRA